jgi:hypothetical protein
MLVIFLSEIYMLYHFVLLKLSLYLLEASSDALFTNALMVVIFGD